MSIAVRCPHCSKSHDVPEGSLGQPTTCQGCGRSFTLTASHDETVAYVQGRAAEGGGIGKHSSASRTTIGRYEIRERLGAGVFGMVYRAYDPVLDRDVAIKLPQAAALDTAEARERFLREARAAGKLRHPHIVPVYDCGQEGDEVFIVAAFIEGQTLAAAIAAGQVDRRRAVLIAAKLAHALGTAHQAGIVHRDVKPANVMLDERGEPQLTDFGLAQLGSTSHLTQQGMLLGTPAYMSPEQALGEPSQIGPASDQYSLGVLLYEMLCRRIPFEGPPLTVLYRVREETPAPPRTIDPTIPPPLEAICLRAMAKQPADRFADCAELSDALRQLDLNAPRAEKPVAPVAPIPSAPAEVRAKSRETAKEPVWQKSSAPAPPGPSGGSGGGSGGGSAGGEFDPYHKWLAIPLAERPPTHYQILGVTPSESDRDVLNMAALQRSAYVRNFQSGKHSEQATRILNEIAAGLACLLDPAKRAAYDAELRKTRPRSAESKPPAARPAAAPAAAAASPLLDPGLLAAVAAEPLAAPAWMLPPPRQRTGLPWWGVASAVGGVAVLVLVAMIALSGGDPSPADADNVPPATETAGTASSAVVVQGEGTQGEVPPEAVTNPQPETASRVAAIDTDNLLDGQQSSGGGSEPPATATNAIGMELVLIPAGEFDMGSPAGEPDRQDGETLHRVRLTKDFYLGRTEVTVGQFRQFVDDTGYKTDAEKSTGKGGRGYNAATGELEYGSQYTWQNPGWTQTDDHPVLNVSWNDAQEFLQWLTNGRPRPYRLPTEAEWEYACRAGTRTTYATGNDPESLVAAANVPDASAKVRFPSWKTVGGADGHVFTAPVGSLQLNAFGLADMHGNVGEWCADWYGPYPTGAVIDPTGPATGVRRVLRGGGWSNFAPFCRSACRNQDFDGPGSRFNSLGFRVARDADPGSATTTVADLGPPAATAPPPWPADAVEFQGHRYKVFFEQLPWRQAKAKCEGMGGHLPIVTSQEENAFLLQLFRSGSAAPQQLDGVWLGATDEAKEGTWWWVDGTPLTYRNWAVGQPNNKQASEHFLMLWVGQGGGWADRPNASTDYRTFYACEWDAPSSEEPAVTSLFDGTTLQGWEGDPARWNVANGIIVGHKPAGVQGDTYLATRDSYENFVFTAKFHLIEGNSGIQFRGDLLPDRTMTGYSADLGYHDNFKYLGLLFLTGQQGARASPSQAQKQQVIGSLATDGWNEYRVTADGNHIVLEINGVEVVNTMHDGPTRGRIGFQLHGGTIATRVEFKDIEIRELPGESSVQAATTGDEATASLFNGNDLTGWEGDASQWKVEDGAIVGQKPAGGQRDTYLATQASYGDFVFAAKFRLHGGNSGIVFRGDLLPDGRMTGYVTDLGYDDDFKYMGWLFLIGTQGPRATPDATPRQRMLDSLDVDGWNEYRITAVGNRIVLEINGVEVVNTTHDGPARGRIGLQIFGGTTAPKVEFKDVEIRELTGASAAPVDVAETAPPAEEPDDGFESLFNGADLSGWRVIGGPREGWVRGGVLLSDGAKGDLATEGEYSDFELSLEFKIGRNGNSGIFLRAADGDMNAQDCAEVQIYDDSTAPDAPPEQRTGSIYNVVAASPPSTAPPGQWQTMVIRVQGTTVRVTLDDVVRVNADLTRYRNRLGQYVDRRRGYIKLQHHRGRVEFRNIRIRELTGS